MNKRVIDHVRPWFPTIALGISVKFAGTIAELLLPYMLSYMIDVIAPLGKLEYMFIFGGLMAVAAVIAFVCNVCANRIASKTANMSTLEIRHSAFDKTLHLSCAQMDRITSPTLVSRLTSDTYNVNMMLLSLQRVGVRAPILVLGGVIMTLLLDRALSLVLLAIIPIAFTVIFIISRRGVRYYTEVQGAADKLVLGMQENLNGIRVIKALSKTEHESEKFQKTNGSLMNAEIKAGTNNAMSGPLLNLFLNFGLVAVVLVGAYRVYGGSTQPGTVIAFLSYFTIILNALMMVNRAFMQLSKGLASAKRIDELLAEDTSDISESFRASGKDVFRKEFSDCRIVFDRVSFSYLKVKNNLSDISFALRPGQTLGVIGATGSGKTTLVSLLLRFYLPDSGNIYIDGSDIRSLSPSELYVRIGVAFQSDFLMADTVRENIAFGRELDNEDIKKAAENAMAADFISAKEGGYGELLNVKGANVSGGQKQRLLISRALAGEPDILILDDSSGGLDYRTDSLLRTNLHTEYPNATKVVVAQRVSSVKNADLILVLDEGRIIGKGTHGELMESCPEYRRIAIAQMGVDVQGGALR